MTRFPPLPPARLGYTDNAIDRASHLREDPGWLASARASAQARFYLVCADHPVLKATSAGGGSSLGDPLSGLTAGGPPVRPDKAEPLFTAREADVFGPALDEVFLGLWDEVPLFARRLPSSLLDEIKSLPPYLVTDLRSIAMQGLVGGVHFAPLAQAKSILYWHERHGFCSACGQPSFPAKGGWQRDCPSCGAQHFPRTDPVVIMLVVDGDNCLMGRQERFPPGMYSALAGFMEPGETIAEAVRREIHEEAGITTGAVTYLTDQPWPFPSSLMIGCLARATSREITIDAKELQEARWFSKEECYAMLTRQHPQGFFCPPPLAIAHHLIRAFVEG